MYLNVAMLFYTATWLLQLKITIVFFLLQASCNRCTYSVDILFWGFLVWKHRTGCRYKDKLWKKSVSQFGQLFCNAINRIRCKAEEQKNWLFESSQSSQHNNSSNILKIWLEKKSNVHSSSRKKCFRLPKHYKYKRIHNTIQYSSSSSRKGLWHSVSSRRVQPAGLGKSSLQGRLDSWYCTGTVLPF